MKIYLVTAQRYGYDEFTGFVIAAESPKQAREMAQEKAHHQKNVFTNIRQSDCVLIGETAASYGRKRPHIVQESFFAG